MDTRKPKRAMFWLTGLSVALLVATRGQAIGIGDSQVKSALNQPLNVSLPILDVGNSQILPGSLRAHLASFEDHQRAGMQYPAHLQNAELTLFETADGRQSIIMQTPNPVAEPLLTFLVQLEWSHGRLLKEISVFLDPPGYQKLPEVEPASTMIAGTSSFKAPVAIATSTPFSSYRPAPVATTSAAPIFQPPADIPVFVEVNAAMSTELVQPLQTNGSWAPVSTSPRAAVRRNNRTIQINNDRYGPVRSGDTLMEIAAVVARQQGGNRKQIAQAIYRANPAAFNGSMNSLNRGAHLTIPTTSSAQTSTIIAAAPTGALSGISTISDFAYNLPAEEIISNRTTPAPRSVTQSSLNIVPADKEATQLARDIRDELAKSRTPEVPAFAEVKDTLTTTGPSEASALPTSGTAENSTLVSLEKQLETPSTQASASDVASTQATNNLQINAGQLATLDATQASLTALIMKWLPWVLLALAVPAILLLAFRRKETPITRVPSRSDALNSTPPQRQDTIDTQRERIEQIDLDAAASDTEFDCETVIIGSNGQAISIAESLVDADQTAEVKIDESQLQASLQDSFVVDDLAPSQEDTQESIRPDFTQETGPATEMLQHQSSGADQKQNNEQDLAQEAEIYLAYGQYMLAENNITKLRNAAPNNDRYKMLALKLFADTGKHTEMAALADDMLKRFPDSNSGIHQQIQKVCERAAIAADTGDSATSIARTANIQESPSSLKSVTQEVTPLAETSVNIEPVQPIVDTQPASLHLVSNHSPTEPMLELEIEVDNSDLDVEFGSEESIDTSHSILDAIDEDEDEDEDEEDATAIEFELSDDIESLSHSDSTQSLDESSIAPTEPATSLAASYEDDIEDYLHEHDSQANKNVTPFNREEPLADSISAIELSENIELDNSVDLEFNELTEEELDAISMDIELLENDASNTLELEDEFASTAKSPREIESFTDTDYRLTALGRSPGEQEGSERLDLPFDLEQELEKLSQPTKSVGSE